MRAKITKIVIQTSHRSGAELKMVCFQCEDGKNRISWIDSSLRNKDNWNGLLEVGYELENLRVIPNKGMIDADSKPVLA